MKKDIARKPECTMEQVTIRQPEAMRSGHQYWLRAEVTP